MCLTSPETFQSWTCLRLWQLRLALRHHHHHHNNNNNSNTMISRTSDALIGAHGEGDTYDTRVCI